MVEIKRVDLDLFKSSHFTFRDDGPVSKAAKTRLFSVFNSSNRSLLGYVKWWGNWRKYCFFPLNSLFDDKCLEQIAVFCREATTAHKSRLPNKKRIKDLQKAKRQRRIEKLAKKKLTDEQSSGIIENVTEIPESINQVVEGSQNLTPLEVELGTIQF